MNTLEINLKDQSVGEIVVNDFRTASLFKKAKLDFCCGGKKTLKQACTDKNINVDKLVKEILKLQSVTVETEKDFKNWPLGDLIDYITNTHHKYVLKTLPELVGYTKKVANSHGQIHPEMIEVANLFESINSELLQHLKKEEEVLFPAIKELLVKNSLETKKLLSSEISRMSEEHEFVGDAMDQIRILTRNYTPPETACNTYIVTLKLLNQFEDDLHDHIHLENNILYPKSLTI